MKVLKYGLEVERRQLVLMPRNAKILCVGVQREVVCLWALCDEKESEKEARVILIYGTGHDHDDDQVIYLGTVQLAGGDLIFHIFEAR